MYLTNLSKAIEYSGGINTANLEHFKHLPFYCEWLRNSQKNHDIIEVHTRNCCFNHVIHLPVKDTPRPLYDYEQLVFNSLFTTSNGDIKDKHLWVKKATGLGITELCLRIMVWLCLRDNTYRNCQMPIVCGPNQDIAIKLIKRIRTMFEPFLLLEGKETAVTINGCTIEAYPSNHIDAYRSLEKPKFILIDEGDFFRDSDQQDVRAVSERYIGKSDPYIVMVSTPNKPGGLFEQIENEPEDKCIYKRMKLDYTHGLNKIYSLAEIKKARASPAFDREYQLRYLGGIGNVFPMQDIEAAIQEYDLSPEVTTSPSFPRWIGVDPGYSSSMFGITVVQWKDDALEVVYTASLDKPLYTDTLTLIRQLVQKYHACKVFIDGSASHLIHELKHGYNEYIQYERLSEKTLDIYIKSGCGEPLIVPVNFQKHHKDMLKHAMKCLAKHRVRIHPSFDKLIVSLKSATTKAEYDLDKPKSSMNDLLDAMQLSLLCLKPEGE